MKSATKVKQKAFLAGFVQAGSIKGAARISGLDRTTHYDWMESDQEYQRSFLRAKAETIDRLEHELNRRAFVGLKKPIIYQGQLQYEPARDANGQVKRDKRGQPILSTEPLFIREYSDNLLMFWLKSLDPQRFRDNSTVAVTGAGGAPLSIDIRFVNPSPPSDAG